MLLALLQCPSLPLHSFVKRAVQQHLVPMPGSVSLFMGGPPCQGVSAWVWECMYVAVRCCLVHGGF